MGVRAGVCVCVFAYVRACVLCACVCVWSCVFACVCADEVLRGLGVWASILDRASHGPPVNRVEVLP